MTEQFIPQKGNYRNLKVYRLATLIYDITYYFTRSFLKSGDRTVDQMVQAARSGKQNIAEGSVAGSTSKETEIKLTNVAKASLHELLADYEDYLRVRGLRQWENGSEEVRQTCRVLSRDQDTKVYMDQICKRSDMAIANIAICALHQADVLLHRLIEHQKEDFAANGGIREQMTAARIKNRGY